MTETPFEFWETRYSTGSRETSGNPSAVLADLAADRKPGRALELGCGKGDDTVWLAKRGWQVTAVDLSHAALDIVSANAIAAGVGDRVRTERHDLSESFPEGQFDLVLAMFLETPFEDFPRQAVVRRAAQAVTPGGMLLLVTHGSAPPWRNGPKGPQHNFPSLETRVAELAADPADWTEIRVADVGRTMTGPEGEVAEVLDRVIALERR
ncbi:class I SAM-dependent methyltransferase [Pelagovum pacificum]|uniref:Class I SAM-dependent methyltransferase n=1 Tax=Pelagovum pacificum TaxID=2588711 RepID=A0A5C5GD68_9RHOB|nr:class I SAM-dependent methyltransferase [Pelagovum pacificum]QQA41260.1 class I SAM-dependent methyltransferase [Pelagovum pacificum]TNY31931.1 class I SAM-dependent methyltransferase [Pelagovum pacificum]